MVISDIPIRPRKPTWRRWSELGLGAALMVLAPLVLGPTAPGPAGLFGFALGLALVLRNSAWAKRRYVRFKRRWPRWGVLTDKGLRRRPRPRTWTAAGAQPANEDREQREYGEAEDRHEHRRVGENAR